MIIKSTKKRNKNYKSKVIKQSEIKVLSENQIKSINFISNKRDKAIIQILLHTGLRANELVNLNYGDVFASIRKKEIPESIEIKGKGNKIRIIYLNNEVKKAILSLDFYNRKELGLKGIRQNTPFIITQKGTRLSNTHLQRITKKYLNINPHTLRHTCFTLMRKRGIRIEVIQKVAGHNNIQTTCKYYLNVNSEDIKNAFNQLKFDSNNKVIDNIIELKKIA